MLGALAAVRYALDSPVQSQSHSRSRGPRSRWWVASLVARTSVAAALISSGCERPAGPERLSGGIALAVPPGATTRAAPSGPSTSVTRAGANDASARSAETSAAPVARACPEGMVEVRGDYCTEVAHTCLRWLDPPGRYHQFRCAEYGAPRCIGTRKPMRFCIDRDEQGAGADEPRPANHVSFRAATAACEARGAHVCAESEWQFACEGEAMLPYPYGTVRDANACNIDRTDLGRPGAGLRDHRSVAGANVACASPFGARDMVGNLEEWVARDPGTGGHRTLLKGSWWLPGRSTCRATNAGHDEVYEGPETGYRCCR